MPESGFSQAHETMPGARELYAPQGRRLGEGERFAFPELAGALERYGAEGAEPFYRGAVAAAFRTIPFKILTFQELGLPPIISELAKKPRGLVLVTGPTGSGK